MDETELDGVAAKLERAEVHMNALYDEITAFFESKPHEFPIERDPETGEHVVRIRVLREPDNPGWGVLLGDFAHNLRSALDHLVWQLVLLSGAKPSSVNQFPIARSEAEYWRPSKTGMPSMRDRMLKGVADEYRKPIDEIQPYHIGDRAEQSPLAILARLSNVDKHRIVHAGFVAAEVPEPEIDYQITGDPGVDVQFEATTGPLSDGDEVLRIKVHPPGSNVYVKSSGPIGMGFGDPPIDDDTLRELLKFFLPFVASFGAFFGLTAVAQGSPPKPKWIRQT